MNWNDTFWMLQGNLAAQASLLSLAWNEAAQSRNDALLWNLHSNMLNPAGVCMALDAANIPMKAEMAAMLQGAKPHASC